ncbi:MAG: alginate lyase family protein, partial [Bryobacteraceae bacterium]
EHVALHFACLPSVLQAHSRIRKCSSHYRGACYIRLSQPSPAYPFHWSSAVRNWTEISFRLKQECVNAAFWLRPPTLGEQSYRRLPVLPDVDSAIAKLRGSPFADASQAVASEILCGRVPLLGLGIVDIGENIRWRRDCIHGQETGTKFFRRIPYLDFHACGDHKIIWELNRHQHLVLLAQVWRLSRNSHRDELFRQLESWMEANPFQCGINWTSALEVAFRAVSWIWIYHLVGADMESGLRRRFLTSLYQHALHLENNLSYYFSPNTHLLGEAIALHAIGKLFPDFPGASRWASIGTRVVGIELDRQLEQDGGHFELSTYYHVYALDMFLFHALLEGLTESWRPALERMAEFLDSVLGPQRRIPFIGDDDGGRFFHPYGKRTQFGRATLATCAVLFNRRDWPYEVTDLHEQAVWWLGPWVLEVPISPTNSPPVSRTFTNTGLIVCRIPETQIIFDAGSFGAGSSGHSHADTLSFTIDTDRGEVLIDPGTYTYVSDPAWRNWFRGTAAHNTVQIAELDQGEPAGSFKWNSRPTSKLHHVRLTPDSDFIDASCQYHGFLHRRRLVWIKPALVLVLDELGGPEGEHLLEQFWHLGKMGKSAAFVFPSDVEVESGSGGRHGWRSCALGRKEEAPFLRVHTRRKLPSILVAAIDLSGVPGSLLYNGTELTLIQESRIIRISFNQITPQWTQIPA